MCTQKGFQANKHTTKCSGVRLRPNQADTRFQYLFIVCLCAVILRDKLWFGHTYTHLVVGFPVIIRKWKKDNIDFIAALVHGKYH